MTTTKSSRQDNARSELRSAKAAEPRISTRNRVLIFAVVCAIALGGTAYALISGRDRAVHSGVAVPTGPPLRQLGVSPTLLFRSTVLNKNFGVVAAIPTRANRAPRELSPLHCDRVDFRSQRGICLQQNTEVFGFVTNAIIFDAQLRTMHTVELPGRSSRTRVSPDSKYAAATTFVSGDSYAEAGFSTRTSIIDMETGSIVLELEKLDVTKDGEPFHNLDFNFWGVTFEQDSRFFYATLGTGGETYLVKGDLDRGTARVVRSGVECPSLSPDGTRIAFKKRNPGPVITWRISILDLSTMDSFSLAESRNVDDQVEWLDNDTVMYGLANDAGELGDLSAATPGTPILGGQSSIETTTWSVPADGSGEPEKLIEGAWSAVPVFNQ